MGGFTGVAPDTIGFCADDALGVGDAPGELSSAPVAGLDYCAHSLLGIGTENVVLYGTKNSLNVSDIAAAGNGGVVVDDTNSVACFVHMSLAAGNYTAIILRATDSPRGVSVNAIEDTGRVRWLFYDPNVLSNSSTIEIEGDEIAGADVPLVNEDAALTGLRFAPRDVGA